MVTGMMFANVGPFRLVLKPVTFQRIWAFLRGCERGKTEHAWAGAFSWERWIGGKLEAGGSWRLEGRGWRSAGEVDAGRTLEVGGGKVGGGKKG